jgi:hypothetical protein
MRRHFPTHMAASSTIASSPTNIEARPPVLLQSNPGRGDHFNQIGAVLDLKPTAFRISSTPSAILKNLPLQMGRKAGQVVGMPAVGLRWRA